MDGPARGGWRAGGGARSPRGWRAGPGDGGGGGNGIPVLPSKPKSSSLYAKKGPRVLKGIPGFYYIVAGDDGGGARPRGLLDFLLPVSSPSPSPSAPGFHPRRRRRIPSPGTHPGCVLLL